MTYHPSHLADYCASKAALVNLNESLRYELDKLYVSSLARRIPTSDDSHRYKTPDIRTTIVLPGHTMTPMFSRMKLPSSWFHKFFAPSVPPYAVAKAVIAAIDEQDSGMIFLPFFAHFVRWVTILPSFLRDLFQTVIQTSLSAEFRAYLILFSDLGSGYGNARFCQSLG